MTGKVGAAIPDKKRGDMITMFRATEEVDRTDGAVRMGWENNEMTRTWHEVKKWTLERYEEIVSTIDVLKNETARVKRLSN